MANSNVANEQLTKPQTIRAFRAVKLLIGGYLTISLMAVVVLVLFHNHPLVATKEAWVHGIIVAATGLLMTAFAGKTLHGSKNGYLRLRISSAVMLVAIVIILAIPGDFPMWMKLEQGVAGLLLLGVVLIVNGNYMRTVFASK